MRKFGYLAAAIVAIAVAAPSIASAETVIIKRGDHHRYDRGPRAEYREHRYHGGWHHRPDKVVIIKRRHHRDY